MVHIHRAGDMIVITAEVSRRMITALADLPAIMATADSRAAAMEMREEDRAGLMATRIIREARSTVHHMMRIIRIADVATAITMTVTLIRETIITRMSRNTGTAVMKLQGKLKDSDIAKAVGTREAGEMKTVSVAGIHSTTEAMAGTVQDKKKLFRFLIR
jgi:hypothetical protein